MGCDRAHLGAQSTRLIIEGSSPAHQAQFRSQLDLGRKFSLDAGMYFVSALSGLNVPAFSVRNVTRRWALASVASRRGVSYGPARICWTGRRMQIRGYGLCPVQPDRAGRGIEGHMGFLRWRRAAGYLAPVLMAGMSMAAEAEGEHGLAGARTEYEIESAMLYNFTKFIDWPDGALGTSGGTLVVGVLADDPMAPALASRVVQDKTIHGHPLVVRRLESTADLEGLRPFCWWTRPTGKSGSPGSSRLWAGRRC